MHDNPKGAKDGRAITPYEEDERDQAAVFRHVLGIHPAELPPAITRPPSR